jgi:hypothetical protein
MIRWTDESIVALLIMAVGCLGFLQGSDRLLVVLFFLRSVASIFIVFSFSPSARKEDGQGIGDSSNLKSFHP